MKHLIIAIICLPLVVLAQEPKGSFKGDVKVQWLRSDTDKDRDMRLLDAFSYRDSAGKTWEVPANAVINGASIPRAFWAFGSPFVGDYREASVIHDYYYHQQDQSRKVVDIMFYEASLTGGVDVVSAKSMFHTLRVKDVLQRALKQESGVLVAGQGKGAQEELPVDLAITEAEIQEYRDWILEKNPSLEKIDARAVKDANKKLASRSK